LFTKDRSYAKQWRYTNAPDAEGRAIQAVYWANKWAKEQGKGSAVASVVSKEILHEDRCTGQDSCYRL